MALGPGVLKRVVFLPDPCHRCIPPEFPDTKVLVSASKLVPFGLAMFCSFQEARGDYVAVPCSYFPNWDCC